MAWWPFRRRGADPTRDKDVDRLLVEARRGTPAARVEPASPGGDPGFRLPVDDVFAITGRGTVVTGHVAAGTVSTGQAVQVVREGEVVATTSVTAIEKFRAREDTATVGEHVGLLLADLSRDQVRSGDLVTGRPAG